MRRGNKQQILNVLRDVASCCFVQNSQCFGTIRCLRFYESCMFTLQKYTKDSFESLAAIYQSTQHDIPENCYLGTDHK